MSDLNTIKHAYSDAMRGKTGVGTATYDAAFDAAIAAHDAEVAAKTLEDAVEEFEGDISPDDLRVEHPEGGRWTAEAALDAWENQGPFMDWLRVRAAGIRGGQ